MRQVPLRSRKYPGLFALVDDEDYDRVSAHTWWPMLHSNTTYVWTRIDGRQTYLHKFILPIPGEVDHKDGNGLNCQRYNLRPATRAQQRQNVVKGHGPVQKPVYKGVRPVASMTNPWRAVIWKDGKAKHLGVFPTAREAARAYDKAAREQFGPFAKTNFEEE